MPAVVYGPGDSSLDHTPNEHIDLHDFQKAVDVLTKVLFNLSG
jgi:LysW-gamma-L-lysine carboxypeptidase